MKVEERAFYGPETVAAFAHWLFLSFKQYLLLNKQFQEEVIEMYFRGAAQVDTKSVTSSLELGVPVNTTDHLCAVETAALHAAVRWGHDSILGYLLQQDGVEIEIEDLRGQTPLFHAIVQGNALAMTLLVQNGADVNAKCHLGETPLFPASQNGDVKAMSFLIQHGANVNAKDSRGETPLIRVVQSVRTSNANVRKLLIHGDDWNVMRTPNGETAVHDAACHINLPAIEHLIASGADLHVKSDRRTSPLDEVGRPSECSFCNEAKKHLRVCIELHQSRELIALLQTLPPPREMRMHSGLNAFLNWLKAKINALQRTVDTFHEEYDDEHEKRTSKKRRVET